MDDIDRLIFNELQGDFPLSEAPFAETAQRLGLTEADLIGRLENMVANGLLSRFGPLFDADRLGGHVTLVAMAVPTERYEEVTEIVNSFPEVAHNYAREHAFNMWFVVSSDRPERVEQTLSEIKEGTGLPVYNFPKQAEYFVGLRLEA